MSAQEEKPRSGFAPRGMTWFPCSTILRGAKDDDLLRKAHDERRVVVTNDKDFGALVVRDQRAHAGVVLLRMTDTSAMSKLAAIRQVVATYGDELEDWLTVVAHRGVRRTRP